MMMTQKKFFELYDILNDPYEKYDLSQEHPEILESMKKTFYEKPINLETPFLILFIHIFMGTNT